MPRKEKCPYASTCDQIEPFGCQFRSKVETLYKVTATQRHEEVEAIESVESGFRKCPRYYDIIIPRTLHKQAG